MIRANSKEFKVDQEAFEQNDFHIHVPEGAIPKEGPSAGVSLTTALLSSLLNKKISSTVAMTGEITLTGKVLAVGGIREKLTAAYRSNIKKVFLPNENKKDMESISDEIKNKIKFVFVDDYFEIYKEVVK